MKLKEINKDIWNLKKKISHLQLSKTMSHSIFHILMMIEKQSKEMSVLDENIQAVPMNYLFDCIHVSKPAVSKMIKECESRGYIKKYVSDKDKRYMYISLTSKGQKDLLKAENEVRESIEWISSHFSDEEVDLYRNLVLKLNQVLDDFNRKDDQNA